MLNEIISKLEEKKKAGEKVNTQKLMKYCKEHNISPPELFKEAAKKHLLGVLRWREKSLIN